MFAPGNSFILNTFLQSIRAMAGIQLRYWILYYSRMERAALVAINKPLCGLPFNSCPITFGARLKYNACNLIGISLLWIQPAAFTIFAWHIIGRLTCQGVLAFLVRTATGSRTTPLLGGKIAHVSAGPVTIFTFDRERLRTRRSVFIFFLINLCPRQVVPDFHTGALAFRREL